MRARGRGGVQDIVGLEGQTEGQRARLEDKEIGDNRQVRRQVCAFDGFIDGWLADGWRTRPKAEDPANAATRTT